MGFGAWALGYVDWCSGFGAWGGLGFRDQAGLVCFRAWLPNQRMQEEAFDHYWDPSISCPLSTHQSSLAVLD